MRLFDPWLRSAAATYLALPSRRQVLVYRIGLAILVGAAAFVVIELAWQALTLAGECTKCSADGDPGGLGAVSLGGGAAAGGLDDDPPGKSRFDNWMDDLLGSGRPPKSVESVDPPSSPPAPAATPEEQAKALEDAKKLFDFYKRMIGTKGPMDMPEGSQGDTLNDAMDRVLDFGETDTGPTSGKKP